MSARSIVGFLAGTVAIMALKKIVQVKAQMAYQGDAVESRISAFLATIRRYESNDDYYIFVGGYHFGEGDTAEFPYHRWYFIDPRTGKQNYSTAAGAYQITQPTFLQFSLMTGITDFTPASQDALARAILSYEGVIDALTAGDTVEAFRLASKRWASMPYSTAMQNPQTVQNVLAYYNNLLIG